MGRAIGRERGEGAAPGRPRIMVTGPKVQPPICQICLGRIKEGTEYVKCSSGKVFHQVCLARTGTCPFCVRTVMKKGSESTTSRPHDLVFVFLPPEEVPETPPMPEPLPELPAPEQKAEERAVCPVCGARLAPGATSCQCGAIFADRSSSFRCPDCGATVNETDRTCGKCGAFFEEVESRLCPACGKELPASAERCECGETFPDLCPGCQARLREVDRVCWSCGAEFEFG